jgi:hypothetical protein
MALDQPPEPHPPVPVKEPPALTAPTAAYVRMGYVFAIVGALLFSTKAIVIKLAYADSDQLGRRHHLLALRMMMALPST